MVRLFGQSVRSPAARKVRPAQQATHFRPVLEGLEDRVVPAHVPVIPLNITGVSVLNGALLAQGRSPARWERRPSRGRSP